MLQDAIETSKENYVEKLLEDRGNNRSFYAVTKRLASATACSEWKVADLFLGKDGHQVGREVLEFSLLWRPGRYRTSHEYMEGSQCLTGPPWSRF